MNGVKSPNIEAVKVVSTRKIQGNVTRKIRKIATMRGANENVWSWIDVSVWIRLITTPTTIAAISIGATIHIKVVKAPCISEVISASFIFLHHTFDQRTDD